MADVTSIGKFILADQVQRPFGHMTFGLIDMMQALEYNHLTAVEIGSYKGESAQIMLSTGQIDDIWCIDPWKNFIDHSDNSIHSNMSFVEKEFDNRFASDRRVHKFKGTIQDFKKSMPDLKVDFFYIDGNHEKSFVVNDIKTALEYKPHLAICGHDFDETREAIYEVLGPVDIVFRDSSWLKWM